MAGKKESNFINMFVSLLVISFVAGLSLGSVYNLTKAPIAAAAAKKMEDALRLVLPDFDSVQPMKVKSGIEDDSLLVYKAFYHGNISGWAVKTWSKKGFGGDISLMAGFRPDGSIKNISVLDHKETPGLGDKMRASKSDWSLQFLDKNPATFRLKVKKDGGDVDAITAATISSRAFTEAVKRAWVTIETYKKEGGSK
ncbi:RnfABCDGE type electron transport complex subunit G [Bacteroidales bacterium]